MRSNVNRLAALWVCPLLLCAGLTMAAGQDLRLVDAVASQNADRARGLLDEGVDVNAARADGVTALLWAAHWDDLDTAGLLLGAGADVNAADDHGVAPLARASENASVAMIATLLAAGANPNAPQTSGLTPLMTAARTGKLEVVEALLASGADVSASTVSLGATALMWAVAAPHAAIVRVLLDAGANPHTSTTDSYTALMYAARNGDIPMAETLIAAGVDINTTSTTGPHILPFTIIGGQDQFALFLLEHGADPNGSMSGIRALHAAVGALGPWMGGFGFGGIRVDRRLPVVEALLAHGADPNARITTSAMIMFYVGHPRRGAFETFACGTGDLRGATPLFVAAYGANGFTGDAFNAATRRPHFADSSAEIIRTLLAAGADYRLMTDDGTTPLMRAAGLGRATHTPGYERGVRSPSGEESVRVLLEAGADINEVNEADFTALHGAAFRGLNEIVQILVENGADINARDFRGRTPFRLAEGSKQSFQFQVWPETAELLRELGANTRLGLPGTVQERLRDIPIATSQNN